MTALPFEPTSVRTSGNGMIALWQQAPIAYSRVKGHFCRDHAQQIVRLVDGLIAEGTSVEQFHDWGEMTGYDLVCQRDLTMWTLSIRKSIKRLTILVHSPVVLMGVRVANAALRGMIHVCESKEEFDRLLVERVSRQRAS